MKFIILRCNSFSSNLLRAESKLLGRKSDSLSDKRVLDRGLIRAILKLDGKYCSLIVVKNLR